MPNAPVQKGFESRLQEEVRESMAELEEMVRQCEQLRESLP